MAAEQRGSLINDGPISQDMGVTQEGTVQVDEARPKFEKGMPALCEYTAAWAALASGNWTFYTRRDDPLSKAAAGLSLLLGCLLSVELGLARLGAAIVGFVPAMFIGFLLGWYLGYIIVCGSLIVVPVLIIWSVIGLSMRIHWVKEGVGMGCGVVIRLAVGILLLLSPTWPLGLVMLCIGWRSPVYQPLEEGWVEGSGD